MGVWFCRAFSVGGHGARELDSLLGTMLSGHWDKHLARWVGGWVTARPLHQRDGRLIRRSVGVFRAPWILVGTGQGHGT